MFGVKKILVVYNNLIHIYLRTTCVENISLLIFGV